MIENRIHSVNERELSRILSDPKLSESTHLVEIQGANIQSWSDYIKIIEDTFKLPTQWPNNMDAYLDWMRDLDWLNKDSYILVIHDFDSFLCADLELKNIIIEDFNDVILPWWKEEVETYTVGGRKKPFNVYLVG